MKTIEQIASKVAALRSHYAGRDARMADIHAVRRGEMEQIAPGMFSEDFPKPLIANMIDTVARDLAEVIAPLPAFNCSASTSVSDTGRRFADKRTKIAAHYVETSKLQTQMFSGADQYLSYGFLPFMVEADVEHGCPRIEVVDPLGCYPMYDRWGRVVGFAQRMIKAAHELCAQFPELEGAIKDPSKTTGTTSMLEVIRFSDADQTVMYLPERHNLVLARATNPLGRCPVVVARRPGLDDEARGQFDDVIWIQLARARFAALALEAAETAVEAPIALPQDVQELALGSNAILRSANPEKIRRVSLDLPNAAFTEGAQLNEEMRVGARYPEGRSGNIDASIVTGRGVQALMGGFDTQVKTAQEVLSEAFREVIGMCFELDEKLWSKKKKTVRGNLNGAKYEVTYTPSKDIAGDHTVDVEYGLLAGLDPNRALVFGLQARGDKLISRDFLRRQLPFSLNVSEEEAQVSIEEYRDALSQAVAGLAQSIPVLAQNGQNPGEVLSQVAGVIAALKKGQTMEDAILAAFPPAPPAPPPGAAPPGEEPPLPGSPGSEGAPGGADMGGLGADGLMPGVAPGQAGMAPGGQPTIQSLLAGLSGSGQPQMSASVSRRLPV